MPYLINEKGRKLVIEVSGEFDAVLAKELQKDFEKYKGKNIGEVLFDFKKTTHIASSGLRIIIFAQERINTDIDVSIINAKDMVLEIIKMSGIDAFVKLVE